MKGLIEHVAVVTPVGSEHDNDALVAYFRFLQSLFDFSTRVGLLVVNVFLFFNRLTSANRAG
jgi:hypothetical protein